MRHVNISKFVEYELEHCRTGCNFTDDERLFFDLRARNMSLLQIQLKMRELGRPCSESKINALSKEVTEKILKVFT